MIVTILICTAPGCHRTEQLASDSVGGTIAAVKDSRWYVDGPYQICPECHDERDRKVAGER